jgi:hypothetical protein
VDWLIENIFGIENWGNRNLRDLLGVKVIIKEKAEIKNMEKLTLIKNLFGVMIEIYVKRIRRPPKNKRKIAIEGKPIRDLKAIKNALIIVIKTIIIDSCRGEEDKNVRLTVNKYSSVILNFA